MEVIVIRRIPAIVILALAAAFNLAPLKSAN
jgi:hypothetical protein